MALGSETDRIRAEYDRRSREIPADFYAFDRAPNLFFLHGRERALRDLLGDAGFLPLGTRRILEVGCGAGEWFPTFERLGHSREHLYGVDLDEERVARARQAAPGAQLRVGDASALPWPDAHFDLVFQSTVFSSILDGDFRRRVAAEMRRTLKPGGAIVWYDFSYDNPKNRSVRGITRREVEALFPGLHGAFKRVTLAPPLARRLVPLSWTLSALLESMKLLNTHLLAVLRAR